MKTHGDEGWSSPICTKPRCAKVLKYGDAVQFLDKDGKQQRYCDPHWVEHNREPEPKKDDQSGSEAPDGAPAVPQVQS